MIHCRLLGPVEITVDGAPPPAELLWRKHLALFIYLCRSPRRRRSRDHLAALLWGDRDDTVARHSLREALRVLRKVLGDEGLDASADQVILTATTLALDTAEFDAAMTRREWAGAAALVHGEFLEGFGVPDASEFENWLTVERLAWRLKGTEALSRAAKALLADGDPLEAVSMAQRALAIDPGAGEGVRVVMQAQALLGDRGAALATYARYLARPGADPHVHDGLAELAERLRKGRWRDLPPAAAAPVRPQLHQAPLVGTGAGLSALLAQWELVRDGSGCRVLLVGGPPGHGKSRLCDELCQRIALEGATVVPIRAVLGDRSEPGAALVGLARAGLIDAPGVPAAGAEALAAFAARLPEWADRYAGIIRGVTPSELGPAFIEILRAMTGEGPMVLAIDDADWLDDLSLRTLERALRDLGAAQLLLILGWGGAPDGAPLDELRQRVGRELAGATHFLGTLDLPALGALVRWALPAVRDTECQRIARRVAADTAGIPLLAVELVRAIALGLEVTGTGAPWPTPERTLDQTRPGELPDVMVAAIRVGVRALSREAQAALFAIAVLGDRVAPVLIGRGAALDGAALASALDELEWQRWVTVETRGYSFVARIVREVVLGDLVTLGQRQRILEAAER